MTDRASPLGATEPLVEVTRGASVESVHRGAIAVADAGGRVVASCGDPRLPAYVRSAAKPFQAMALFESGAVARFAIPVEELAIVIASHSGEAFHLRLVESLQKRSGVRTEWLRCGAHPPYDPVARLEMLQRGGTPTVLHNNCSGKHVGMLAACLAAGAPVESYLDPGHPVQEANRRRLARLAGIDPGEIGVGVDGCSAPTFRLPLASFAAAFARLAAAGTNGADGPDGAEGAEPGLAEAWHAMREHPDVIGGTHERLDTDLMRAAREAGVPLVAKAGAEGTYAIGVRTERGPLGIALKVEDGAERGRNAAAIETLAQLGALPAPLAVAMREYHRPPVRNRAGLVAGEIRPCFRLRS